MKSPDLWMWGTAGGNKCCDFSIDLGLLVKKKVIYENLHDK